MKFIELSELQFMQRLERIASSVSDPETFHEAITWELTYDQLARKRDWAGLFGRKVLEYAAVQRFGWRPAEVRSMDDADLRFALHEELHGISPSPKDLQAVEKYLDAMRWRSRD